MYQFKPYTERIARMKVKVRDRLIIADAGKMRLKFESQEIYKNYPPVIQKAAEDLYIIERAPLDIEEDEFFVGDLGHKHWGGSDGIRWLMVDIENTWPIWEDGLHHAPDEDPLYSHQKLAVSPEELKDLRELMKIQMASPLGVRPQAYEPEGVKELSATIATTYGRPGGFGLLAMPGHLTPGFQNVMRKGYAAIRKQASDWMEEHKGKVFGQDIRKYIFYNAACIACDGIITLTKRYADIAREKAAKEENAEKKAEYEMMADSLDWIAYNPPRNFWEALQHYMLYNVLMRFNNGPGVTSIGRFDQYTWPYLKKELEEGTITEEHAQELVDAFFLKLNIFYGGGFGPGAQTAGIGHIGQHTTIGGCDPKTGKESSNPVTYMVLEAEARLELHEPTISLRISKDTPDELWNLAIETSKRVGGLPLLQNDDIIIPAILRERKMELEDARNFAFIGCQEVTGSGNDYPAPNAVAMGHNGLMWPICLLMTINNGINPMNGAQGPEEVRSGYLYEMETFEDVKKAFEKLTKYYMEWSITLNNYADYMQPLKFCYPNLSISTDGCMEKGMDVSEGGAKYNYFGGTATGTATVGDSLTAIRWAVYDKKICSAKTLLDAVLANWEGPEYEALRQRILNECPRYGNADPYADEQQKYVLDWYYNMTRGYSTCRAEGYSCGMFGASDHVPQGEITWATPDGRKTGTPIADAMSPVQGMDTNGPTGVFNSTLAWDNGRFMSGMAVNIRIHPTALSREEGVEKLRDMTKAFFEGGGMEVQYNVVGVETLRDAQEHPDDYHNLVVRIAGYSAYFVDMTEAMQNDLISRTEHSF